MPRSVLGSFLIALPVVAAGGNSLPDTHRRAALVELVRQDCGSCHGMTLRGGLGPSLESAALAAKDPQQLRFVILHGRRGTPMPPWREHLTDSEARWIVELLQQGLPQ